MCFFGIVFLVASIVWLSVLCILIGVANKKNLLISIQFIVVVVVITMQINIEKSLVLVTI